MPAHFFRVALSNAVLHPSVFPNFVPVLPSQSSGGIMATSDKSQFKVLLDSTAMCVCVWVFLLQQEHLADVGPKLLHSYSKSSLFCLASHRHTHTGVLYLRQSEPPAFHIPSLLVSLNPPWLNTYQGPTQLKSHF